MEEKGYFIVFRDNENPKDIHFKQIELKEGEVIPENQLLLRDNVDRALTTIRMLFEKSPEKFEEYFRALLSLSQLGLVGGSANPVLASRVLETLKSEIVSREGGKIKNQYMKQLGKSSLLLGLPAAIGGIVIIRYFPDHVLLSAFLFLWVGCMAGVWLSFGARKITLEFDELNILEKDRLNPMVRLIFAGLLTIVIGLLIVTKAMVLELGGLSTASFLNNIQIPLLIGAFCGISEQALSTKVAQHAGEFLGLK